MRELGWSRIPPALRVGLLLEMAAQVLRLVTYTRAADSHVEAMNQTVELLSFAAWATSAVLCLFGAIELTRRTPRALTLVVAYGSAVAIAFGYVGLNLYFALSDSHAYEWYQRFQYVGFASTVTLVVGWSLVSRNAGLIVALAITMFLSDPPPFADPYALLFGDNFSKMMSLRAGFDLAATATALVAAAHGPALWAPAPPRAGVFERMALVAGIAGGAMVAMPLVRTSSSALAILLFVVAIGGVVWLAAAAAFAQRAGEVGGWLFQLASASWLLAAMMLVSSLTAAIEPHELGGATPDPSAPPLLVPLLLLAGFVLALAAVTRIARACGADRAAQVAMGSALVVVTAGAVVVGAGFWSDLPESLGVGGLACAFAAVAYGLRGAGQILGGDGGSLPTATLRR